MIASFAHRLHAVAALTSLAGIAAGILPAHAQSLDQLYANAKDEGALAFYVGGPTAPWEERAKAFEQLYPGIKISIGGGFSNVLDKKIDQQIAAGKLEVDAAILQTIADFARWKNEGRLLIFKPDGFDAMDASFKDADGAFWATMVNIVPYMVNTDAGDDVTLWVFHHIVRKYG
jgi:ABC-type glycerol-3-phosphate transport system substrate-binding protein